MSIINTPTTLMTPEKARKIAEELNGSDDWSYRVVDCPKGKGFSFVEIFDEDGEFVGKL